MRYIYNFIHRWYAQFAAVAEIAKARTTCNSQEMIGDTLKGIIVRDDSTILYS